MVAIARGARLSLVPNRRQRAVLAKKSVCRVCRGEQRLRVFTSRGLPTTIPCPRCKT